MVEDMNAERACGISTSLQPVASASQGPTDHPAMGPQEMHLKPSGARNEQLRLQHLHLFESLWCRLDKLSTSGALASPPLVF